MFYIISHYLKRLNVALLILLNMVFFWSCIPRDHIPTLEKVRPDGIAHVTVGESFAYSKDPHYDPIILGAYYGNSNSYLEYRLESEAPTTEALNFKRERERIINLENKKRFFPSKSAKYDQKLQQEKEKMEQRRQQRITLRETFLNGFYTDLKLLGPDGFTKKYRKHCSDDLLKQLEYANLKLLHNKGYYWGAFLSRDFQEQDLTPIYLEGEPKNVADEKMALYMFGDSLKKEVPKYPYYNTEDKWYRVGTGLNAIMVQVDGEGKYITITGLVNPELKFAVKK